MHILLTGGAGFIGSNFIHLVLRERPTVRITNLDVLTYSGNLENLSDAEKNPRYRFVKGDICDDKLVAGLVEECDAIVHMAAESHVDRSILDSKPFVVSNVIGTQTLLDAARKARGGEWKKSGRFVYVSTDEVYGSLPLDNPAMKFTEKTPLETNSPYSASKAGGDMLARAYHHTFHMDILTTRCSNNFGRFQFPEKVIPLFVTNLMEGKKVPLYGDGKNVRDWLHVDDHCDALLTLLEFPGIEGETFNIGAQHELDVLTITGTLLELLNKPKTLIRYVEDRPGHDRRYAVDSSKLTRVTGWTPKIDFKTGIRQTVEWFQANEAWWRPIKQGEFREYYERMYGQRKVLGEVKA